MSLLNNVSSPGARTELDAARLTGAGLLILLGGFAIVGPLVIPVDPSAQDFAASLAPIGGDYLLGADHYGRSLLARLAHGARLSFGMAFLTMLAAAIPGVLLGLLAAWKGSWTEKGLELVATVVLALPGLMLVLLLLAFSPGNYGPLFLGLALTLWVEFYRVTKTTTKTVLAQPHIEAARMLGFGSGYIITRYVLPVIAPMIATLSAFAMATAIIAVSTLSAISVGLQPPAPELGSMIVELLPYYTEAPVHVLLPAALIFLLVLGLQLLAQGERA